MIETHSLRTFSKFRKTLFWRNLEKFQVSKKYFEAVNALTNIKRKWMRVFFCTNFRNFSRTRFKVEVFFLKLSDKHFDWIKPTNRPQEKILVSYTLGKRTELLEFFFWKRTEMGVMVEKRIGKNRRIFPLTFPITVCALRQNDNSITRWLRRAWEPLTQLTEPRRLRYSDTL